MVTLGLTKKDPIKHYHPNGTEIVPTGNLDPPDDGRIVTEDESEDLKHMREEEKIMRDIEMNSIKIGDAVVIDHCPY